MAQERKVNDDIAIVTMTLPELREFVRVEVARALGDRETLDRICDHCARLSAVSLRNRMPYIPQHIEYKGGVSLMPQSGGVIPSGTWAIVGDGAGNEMIDIPEGAQVHPSLQQTPTFVPFHSSPVSLSPVSEASSDTPISEEATGIPELPDWARKDM